MVIENVIRDTPMKIYVDVQLQYPFAQSLEILHELVRLWGLNLLVASTRSSKAKLSFPDKSFKKMFNESPRKGEIIVPEGIRTFIARMWVTEVSTQ